MKGYIGRIAVAAAITIAAVSYVAPADAGQVPCSQLGATRAYVLTLFDKDYAGRHDMDVRNDYLSDVPARCRAEVLSYGKLIAKSYELSK